MRSFGNEYAFRSGWSRLQHAYIRLFGVVDLPTRIRARAVFSALNRLNCDSILDVGAGTGVYAYCASRDPSRRVFALDIDAERIEAIKRISRRLGRSNLSASCGDETTLDALPNEGFAVVLAVEVLQYFPDPSRTLRSLHARLIPGGTIIAHVPIRTALWPHEHTVFDDELLHNHFLAAGFEPPDILHTFGRASRALCRAYTWCASRPALLAAIYPLLLLAIALTPNTFENGECRLIVARKSIGEGNT
ncbi:MAG: class I SAM-dependent methyltransferase [Burkholderiales bacterium]|nr:class I SAM-dependent methyltransferase [Burkholderiales bacterium]